MKSLLISMSMKLMSTTMITRIVDTCTQGITIATTKMRGNIHPITLIPTTRSLTIAVVLTKINIADIETAKMMRNNTCRGKRPAVGHICAKLMRVKRSVSGSVLQNHITHRYSEPSTVRSLTRTTSSRIVNGRPKKKGFTWTGEEANQEISMKLKGISRLEDQRNWQEGENLPIWEILHLIGRRMRNKRLTCLQSPYLKLRGINMKLARRKALLRTQNPGKKGMSNTLKLTLMKELVSTHLLSTLLLSRSKVPLRWPKLLWVSKTPLLRLKLLCQNQILLSSLPGKPWQGRTTLTKTLATLTMMVRASMITTTIMATEDLAIMTASGGNTMRRTSTLAHTLSLDLGGTGTCLNRPNLLLRLTAISTLKRQMWTLKTLRLRCHSRWRGLGTKC